MTHSFKTKAQQFVSDVMTDTKKPDKSILKSSSHSSQQNGSTTNEPHTYREENRFSEKGKIRNKNLSLNIKVQARKMDAILFSLNN